MKNKSMLIAIALCAGLQLGVIFCEETFVERIWRWWNPRTTATSFEYKKAQRGVSAGVAGAALIGVQNADFGIRRYLLGSGFSESDVLGLQVGGLLMLAGGFSVAVLGSIINIYQEGGINYRNAVQQTRYTLVQMLSNAWAYPTPSSKIHALLKKNEWYFPDFLEQALQKDTSGIIDKACKELGRDINNSKISPQQEAINSAIDNEMTVIRQQLIMIPNLQERISQMEQKQSVKTFLALFNDPQSRAEIALYLRSEAQRVAERESGQLQSEELQRKKELKDQHLFTEKQLRGRVIGKQLWDARKVQEARDAQEAAKANRSIWG